MRLVLINHNSNIEVAKVDLSTNTISFPNGKEIIVDRNLTLKGRTKDIWFAATDCLNYGAIPYYNGGHILIPSTKEELKELNLVDKAEPVGSCFIKQGDFIYLHSVWQIK
jgi:hypothetical protein